MTTSAIPSSLTAELSQSSAVQRELVPKDASRETFLRMLVAQIQNQDPLEPLDPTQFVSQLAQFSSMEQLLEMRQTLEDILGVLSTPVPQASEVEEPAVP